MNYGKDKKEAEENSLLTLTEEKKNLVLLKYLGAQHRHQAQIIVKYNHPSKIFVSRKHGRLSTLTCQHCYFRRNTIIAITKLSYLLDVQKEHEWILQVFSIFSMVIYNDIYNRSLNSKYNLLTQKNLIEVYLLHKQATSEHSPKNHHGQPYAVVCFQGNCTCYFHQSSWKAIKTHTRMTNA